jgi:uncharacterized membrane protein (UPF0182 family)
MSGPIIIDYDDIKQNRSPQGPRLGLGVLIGLGLLLLLTARWIASFTIEYAWWQEMGQVSTWFEMISYGFVPRVVAGVIVFLALWTAYFVGAKPGGLGMATFALMGVSALLSLMFIDSWTAVRYFGARAAAVDPQAWRDPVFGQLLPFYLFELPFYEMVLRLVLVASMVTLVVYWVASHLRKLLDLRNLPPGTPINLGDLGLTRLLDSLLVRGAGVIFLLSLAGSFYLDRFSLLTTDHGFMVGVDYVAETISLPLNWGAIGACVMAAALIALGHFRPALLAVAVAVLVPGAVAKAVNWAYVRPNEISIQRPYIERHIATTRAAYGLDKRLREVEFGAKITGQIDATKHKPLLDNVRLWDWRAFHDTITQIQALRPYYVFPDSDVDRYQLSDGGGPAQIRQVLVTPRELDVRQLPDVKSRWINPHFIYTHGYGVVMAEANRITSDGLPELLIKDAPLTTRTGGLKVTRPQIYYGEAVHEPVFVRTGQPEFDYPSGSDNVHTRYEGKGGFPVSSFPMRVAAALAEGDWNIVLTSYLTPESRMMIRRKVLDRLENLAGFMKWDADPYLVIAKDGRLVWMVDGFTTSNAHPYARLVNTRQFGPLNYIRNSVKATIDAYDGTVSLYIFDPADPIVQAYSSLFPTLFKPLSEMPADLREHARYPETIFRIQAELFRTFHMHDPEAFYNKEDLWDIARTTSSQDGEAAPSTPTYLVATLPDSDTPEFLLMIPFTPRNKDNLIGMMVARCDGDKLGEIVILELSKQELIFGPMQIKARINQDQTISKDLTLWNQQGSKVIRGQMLVLPIDKTFLYVEPIYLQASQAPMPQLKKVALALGNQLAYADTYEQALAQISNSAMPAATSKAAAETSNITGGPPPVGLQPDRRMDELRGRMRRYRELMSQGKFGEAGKELEQIEALLK